MVVDLKNEIYKIVLIQIVNKYLLSVWAVWYSGGISISGIPRFFLIICDNSEYGRSLRNLSWSTEAYEAFPAMNPTNPAPKAFAFTPV